MRISLRLTTNEILRVTNAHAMHVSDSGCTLELARCSTVWSLSTDA